MCLRKYPQGLPELTRVIKSHYKSSSDTLYIVVNNLDGPMLRNDKAQSILASLAATDNIHLIASLDHIRAPLRKLTCG